MPESRKTRKGDGSVLLGLLSEAAREANAEVARGIAHSGLPYEQWRVLEVLADENGRSIGALARAVSMKISALSKLVDRMVAAALVQRTHDPEDQRRVLVYISDIGLERFRELADPVRQGRAAIDSRLGARQGRELERLLREFIGH
jgi:DNA-binding MarR family transcriptional regulator